MASWWKWNSYLKSLTTGLSINGTTVASNKRLNCNEKPLGNLVGVINSLKPMEYDQTISLIEHRTDCTPQFHQCGFIVQNFRKLKNWSTQWLEEKLEKMGKRPSDILSFNIVFTYAIKAVQELHQLVKQRQAQIDAQPQQIDRAINVKLNAWLLSYQYFWHIMQNNNESNFF